MYSTNPPFFTAPVCAPPGNLSLALLLCHSQEQLQPATPMAAGMLQASQLFSKQTQLHQQLRVKSTVLHSSRIWINTQQPLQVPVPAMAHQALHKYSNFGNISLVRSFYDETKQNHILLEFPDTFYFTICLHKTMMEKVPFALFHITLKEVRKPSLVPRIYFKLLTSWSNWITNLWRETLVSLKPCNHKLI